MWIVDEGMLLQKCFELTFCDCTAKQLIIKVSKNWFLVSESQGVCFILMGGNPSSSLGGVLPGGVLRTSSDGDDRRIFLGLKFSIPGFFWV